MAGGATSSSVGAAASAKLGLALLLVAGIFDAEPLYVPGVALPGPRRRLPWHGCRSGARGVSIERSLLAARVVEDEPLAVEIVLTQQPRGGAVVPGRGSRSSPEPLAVRGGRRQVRCAIDARFPRRGRQRLEPPAAIVRDPLGLAQRVVTGARRDEVLVLPRVEPIRLARRRRRAGRDDHAADAPGGRARRPRSTSTGCARTARARPRRGSTGRRSPAPGSCSSGGCAPRATRGR